MENTGPVAPQVTTTHNPLVPPPPPGAKPSTVTKAQPVAITPTTTVDRSTQAPSQAPRIQISERVKQGVTALEKPKHARFAEKVEEVPAQDTTAETTSAEKPADDKTAEKSEKKEEPLTVVHKRSLGERVIAKVVAPFKFIGNVVKTVVTFVTKPLLDYVITPVYEGFLYIFQPAKYEARKLEQKAAAEKAELDQKRANRQAFEKACLDVAMKRLTGLHKESEYIRLAAQYGVTELEVRDDVVSQEARAEANHLFHKQLDTHNLELNALRVNPETGKLERKLLRVDEETGKKYYATRIFTPATEKTRAAVVVTEKYADGNDVEKLLDADDAKVAMRLGNDSAHAEEQHKYNIAFEEYQQKLADFKKKEAKYQKAKQKAEKKDKAFDQKAPVHPGEPPKAPVFKCTDEKVIAAFKLQSEQYRKNLEAEVEAITKAVQGLKDGLTATYPGHRDTTHFIRDRDDRDSEAYKTRIEERVKNTETWLHEQRNALKTAEENKDQHQIQRISGQIKSVEMGIDILKRQLAIIYAKECELMPVQAELAALNRDNPDVEENRAQDIDDWKNGALVIDPEALDNAKRISGTRDRLEIDRLKDWVYKDAKGNVLDIFTRDASGSITGVDKDKYALVNDFQIPTPDKRQNRASDYKVFDMTGSYSRDQLGMEWSQLEQPIRRYVTLRDENGKILKNSDGSVRVKVVTVLSKAHWAGRDSNVIGQHKKVAVFGNRIPRGKPEVPVESDADDGETIFVPEIFDHADREQQSREREYIEISKYIRDQKSRIDAEKAATLQAPIDRRQAPRTTPVNATQSMTGASINTGRRTDHEFRGSKEEGPQYRENK